jgi:signal transduction histidine kinase/ligand-binding sensor domain-containing protein/DNA-binding NarL/FixJ family response regulator
VFASSAGLPHTDVRCLFEAKHGDSSTLWAGTTKGGLARFDGSRWERVGQQTGLPGTGVASITETVDAKGRRLLWVGTLFGGLACFDGSEWSSYDITREPQYNNALSLVESVDGAGARVLWVGAARGLYKFDLEQRTFVSYIDLPNASCLSLIRTKAPLGSDLVWAGSGMGEILRIEKDEWNTYGEAAGLPSTMIFSLLATDAARRPGTIWVGTDAGLAHIDEHGWWTIDERLGIPHKVVWSFASAHTEGGAPGMLIGTDGGGAALLGPSGWSVIDTKSGIPSDVVWRVAETVWDGKRVLRLGTERGLSSRVDDRWELLDQNSGLPHFAVRALRATVDDEGKPALWIATGAGLCRLERGGITNLDSSSDPPLEDVWTILETVDDAGVRTLWLGSRGSGLVQFERGRWSVHDAVSGLPNNMVLCIYESRSPKGERTLWVGTQGGGVAYMSLSSPTPGWKLLNALSSPALPNNTVYQICEDTRGRLYFATNKGVARLTPRTPSHENPFSYSIHTFTIEDGLPSNECNAGASLVDPHGRIWIGTVEGIAILDPAQEVEDREPGPLFIERIRLNGTEIELTDRGPFAHDENNLEFEYALLSFRRERDTRYRTQLLGFDADWSDWTPDYRRTYTNLSRGDYAFRVCGRDSDGSISEVVTVSFRIKSAPWRTWWAYLAYGAAVAGAGFGGMLYRTRSLQQRSEQLTSLVDERTAELASTVERLKESEQRALEANRAKSLFLSNMSHELRTPLNAVIGLSGLLERDRSLTADQQQTLGIIQRSGEHLLALINDVLSLSKIEAGKISLNLQPFDIRTLLQSVHEMTKLRAESKKIEIAFNLDAALPRTVYGDESKLRQVLINLIGNAVKFTDSGRIEVRVGWSGATGRASFEVEDTGGGIAVEELGKLFQAFEQTATGVRSQEGTGLGLVISREIVRLMNGDIWVRSQTGLGATFGFDIDLPAASAVPIPASHRVVALAPTQQEWRVLVADDTAENRLVLMRLLSSVGISAREVADGEGAVRIWSEWHPHLIWMDVRMPGMDGIEATRAIRSAESNTGASLGDIRCRIIALTASVFEHERDAILDVGADDLVVKPFREGTIFEKLEQHLALSFVRDAADAESELPFARVSELPREMVEAIYNALWVGDADSALRAVEEAYDIDPPLADGLAQLIRGYRFKEALGVLRPDTEP